MIEVAMSNQAERNIGRSHSNYAAALACAQENGFVGDRLPRGDRRTSSTCPMAKAIGPDQWSTLSGIGSGAENWINEFDKGLWPEFESV